MADIIDDANEMAEAHLRAALLNRQRPGIIDTTGVGFCLQCEKDLPSDRRWCDATCRDKWQKDHA